jgi:hypothetical protein
MPVAAGAWTALLTGGVMAAIAFSAGGLLASMPEIVALTAVLVVAGVVYGWLVETERLRADFGPGILFWSAAFPAARLSQEFLVGTAGEAGLSEGLLAFLAYQALVGGAFGLGFLLLHQQISRLLNRG